MESTEAQSLKLFPFLWRQVRLLLHPDSLLVPDGQSIPPGVRRSTRLLALCYLTTGALVPAVVASGIGWWLWSGIADPADSRVMPLALCAVVVCVSFMGLSALNLKVSGVVAGLFLSRHIPDSPDQDEKTTPL